MMKMKIMKMKSKRTEQWTYMIYSSNFDENEHSKEKRPREASAGLQREYRPISDVAEGWVLAHPATDKQVRKRMNTK